MSRPSDGRSAQHAHHAHPHPHPLQQRVVIAQRGAEAYPEDMSMMATMRLDRAPVVVVDAAPTTSAPTDSSSTAIAAATATRTDMTSVQPPPSRPKFALQLHISSSNASGAPSSSSSSSSSTSSMVDLGASFEITPNGTLRSRGFEIKDSGLKRVPLRAPTSARSTSSPYSSLHLTPSPRSPATTTSASGGGVSFDPSASANSSRFLSMSATLGSSSIVASTGSESRGGSPRGASASSNINLPSPVSPGSLMYASVGSISSTADLSAPPSVAIVASDLVPLEQLGQGACSAVRRALHVPTCRIVALKPITVFQRDKRKQLMQELSLLSTVRSPYLISLHGAYFSDGVTTLVLEYMNRNSLLEQLRAHGPMNEFLLRHIALALFRGLADLAALKMIHRDIKPGNVLINRYGEVKLADFGVLTELDHTHAMASTFVGTALFMAPERIQNEAYSYPSDIWSAGITLYYLATGRQPYDGAGGMFGLVQSMTTEPEPRLPADRFSPAQCDLLSRCLVRNPADRWTAPMLLEHPFFASAELEWSAAVAAMNHALSTGVPNAHDFVIHPCLLAQPHDESDCRALCRVLIEHAYVKTSTTYRASLFEIARLQRMAEQLAVPAEAVRAVFEEEWAEWVKRCGGGGSQ